MKISYLINQIKRGARKYHRETGEIPSVFSIKEDDEDMALYVIHFCSKTEYKNHGYSSSAHTPHLYYSFDPSGSQTSKIKWDGLAKWRRDQLP